MKMIKGVNRQVVEVNDTGCDYFEKIMFFVKPELKMVEFETEDIMTASPVSSVDVDNPSGIEDTVDNI